MKKALLKALGRITLIVYKLMKMLSFENKFLVKQKAESVSLETPPFVAHEPELEEIEKISKEWNVNNIIIIGNGGSVNNTRAFYGCLGSLKNVYFVMTMEPYELKRIAGKCSPEDSVVVAVSKSGTTVGVIEALMYFIKHDYRVVGITQKKGALSEICNKKGYQVIEHPEVGGRFSARTACAYFPAALMGMDIRKIEDGFKSFYEKAKAPDNPALEFSLILYELEKKGIADVFLPVYSTRLSAFLPIIIQLMHESFGKDGKGLSFFGDMAPESQHHTNQRLFGGKENISALFMQTSEEDDEKILVPDELKDIKLKSETLRILDQIKYSKALEFEFEGTYRDAAEKNIPVGCLSLERVDEKGAGEFMGFWQYVAVYSAWLRGVNPYDQPQVEASKNLSFELRKNLH